MSFIEAFQAGLRDAGPEGTPEVYRDAGVQAAYHDVAPQVLSPDASAEEHYLYRDFRFVTLCALDPGLLGLFRAAHRNCAGNYEVNFALNADMSGFLDLVSTHGGYMHEVASVAPSPGQRFDTARLHAEIILALRPFLEAAARSAEEFLSLREQMPWHEVRQKFMTRGLLAAQPGARVEDPEQAIRDFECMRLHRFEPFNGDPSFLIDTSLEAMDDPDNYIDEGMCELAQMVIKAIRQAFIDADPVVMQFPLQEFARDLTNPEARFIAIRTITDRPIGIYKITPVPDKENTYYIGSLYKDASAQYMPSMVLQNLLLSEYPQDATFLGSTSFNLPSLGYNISPRYGRWIGTGVNTHKIGEDADSTIQSLQLRRLYSDEAYESWSYTDDQLRELAGQPSVADADIKVFFAEDASDLTRLCEAHLGKGYVLPTVLMGRSLEDLYPGFVAFEREHVQQGRLMSLANSLLSRVRAKFQASLKRFN